jgi:formate hydrogenlyase transcriptional activator
LQNFIERAVILSPGKVLRPPLEELILAPERTQHIPEGIELPDQGSPPKTMTLIETERDHIMKILRETNWIVGGPRGAARILGVPRTTLASMMQRLGIFRAAA